MECTLNRQARRTHPSGDSGALKDGAMDTRCAVLNQRVCTRRRRRNGQQLGGSSTTNRTGRAANAVCALYVPSLPSQHGRYLLKLAHPSKVGDLSWGVGHVGGEVPRPHGWPTPVSPDRLDVSRLGIWCRSGWLELASKRGHEAVMTSDTQGEVGFLGAFSSRLVFWKASGSVFDIEVFQRPFLGTPGRGEWVVQLTPCRA